MTLGVLYAMKERRLACPEEISLISFDDHDWAPLFSPPLTVIRQPVNRLGQAAARLLMRMIARQPFEIPAPMPVELIERGSCRRLGPEPTDNSNSQRRNDVFRNHH
jgi:LacI family transcriptional regulator